jgi:peptidoglycan/LPS O-acetylase OafA/YrhL
MRKQGSETGGRETEAGGERTKGIDVKQRNPVFDVLRFFFVLCIVGYHFAPVAQRESWWIFSNGQVFVSFFFVLSGFLAHVSSAKKWPGAWEFLRGRFFSLAFVYYATLLIAVGIEWVAGGFRPFIILVDALLLQAWIPGLQLALNAPAWFMSALLFCFAAYPLVRSLGVGWLALFAVIYWAAVQAVVLATSLKSPLGEFSYWLYFPPFHFASFAVGALVGAVYSAWPRTHGRIAGFVIALLATICCLAVLPQSPEFLRDSAEVSFAAPLFGFLVWAATGLPASVIGWLDRPWVTTLGLIAFPVYLLQLPVFKIYHHFVVKGLSHDMTWPMFVGYLSLLLLAGCLLTVISRAASPRQIPLRQ